MKNLIRTKIFALAFFFAYVSYFAITVLILDVSGPGFGIGHTEHGFPFTYYYSHCFGGYYVTSGLIGNSIVAGAMGVAFALAISSAWSKFSSPEFRAKWYL